MLVFFTFRFCRYGGKRIFLWGVSTTAVLTVLTPPLARIHTSLLIACRSVHFPPSTCYMLPDICYLLYLLPATIYNLHTCYLLPATCYLLPASCYLLPALTQKTNNSCTLYEKTCNDMIQVKNKNSLFIIIKTKFN